MAGLIPASRSARLTKDVDARHKAGHDELSGSVLLAAFDQAPHDRRATFC